MHISMRLALSRSINQIMQKLLLFLHLTNYMELYILIAWMKIEIMIKVAQTLYSEYHFDVDMNSLTWSCDILLM